MKTKKSIAVIGAGLAGLTLADQLADDAKVTVFEKFSSVSGRMATRLSGEFAFDHGAQFFTVKTPAFAILVDKLREVGVVARWDARFAEIDGTQQKKIRVWQESFPHYVGVPNMVAVGQYLHAQLLRRNVEIRLDTEVTAIRNAGRLNTKAWQLLDSERNTLGHYDWVVTALPAPQTLKLLPDTYAHGAFIRGVQMQPCYTLMLGFTQPLELAWDAAHVRNSILSWLSVNSSKPKRPALTTLVAMSTNRWATEHFNHSEDWVIERMLAALAEVLGHEVRLASQTVLKKWHHANAPKLGADSLAAGNQLMDAKNRLACCGDWCISGRVESAFHSAIKLSQAIQPHLIE